jgi:Fic family protein
MNTEQFGPNKTGRLVGITEIPGATHAFIPDPLPPNWEWPSRLWPLLRDASVALGRLDEVGKYLPNPELVITPIRDREAQQSSRLEGTITLVREQLLFEVAPSAPTSSNDTVNDFKEVANYKRALKVHEELKENLPISLRLIKELHRVLMEGVRGGSRAPGEFRRLPSQVGDPPRYVPPPPNFMVDGMNEFEKSLHSDMRYDPLVDAFIAHYQFEAIHPFRDGNGRVGRLLLAILIQEWSQLSQQWLYMSSYFGKTKSEYQDRLLHVSTEGDWEGWIEYCLKGVIAEANETQGRCGQLRDLIEDFRRRIERAEGSVRLSSISDSLFVLPAVRVTDVVKTFEVSYPTAKKYLDELESLGIVEPLPHAKQKTFFAPRILGIAHGDIE